MSDADLGKIKGNVAIMVQKGAPEKDIDRYISESGTTLDAVKGFEAQPEGFWSHMKRDTLAGNMLTGAQESGVSAMQAGQWVGKQLYGPSPSDASESAAYDAAQSKLEKQEGPGVGNWIARQAGDPLNYPLAEIGGKPAVKVVTKGAEKIVGGAKEVASGGKLIHEGWHARAPEMLEAATQNMEQEGHASFKAMRDSGVSLNPQVASALTQHIDTEVRKMGVLTNQIHGGTTGLIKQMANKAKSGMSVDELHQFRKLFRRTETMATAARNKEGAEAARTAIDAIDEAVETVKAKAGPGQGTAALESMQKGIKTWAKMRKFETISDAVEKSRGDPDKLKTSLKKIFDSPKLNRGFTKEEMKALETASENTTAESLLKMVGKFGFDVSRGVAGNKAPFWTGVGAKYLGAPTRGIVELTGAGSAARYGQKLAGRGSAERLLRTIERGDPADEAIGAATDPLNARKAIK